MVKFEPWFLCQKTNVQMTQPCAQFKIVQKTKNKTKIQTKQNTFKPILEEILSPRI